MFDLICVYTDSSAGVARSGFSASSCFSVSVAAVAAWPQVVSASPCSDGSFSASTAAYMFDDTMRTAVVNSLVKDIFTPLIGLLVGGIDFTNIFVTLKGPSQPTLADAQKAGAVTLNIGVFLIAVIQFLIVSLRCFG